MGRHPASCTPGETFTRLVGIGPAATVGLEGTLATINNGRFVAHKDLRVKSFKVTALDAVTGADTDTVSLALRNLGAAGAGTVDIASLALVSAVNMGADTPKVIPLSATAADLLVAAGDVLTFRQVKVGDGQAIPAMHGQVEYELQ
ncbi:MAG: hypothetical protein NTY36_01285 [Deltaproteobacteria bacterium]|nr:hypothetical protein [Deltaproteobacteria bacterium]